AYVLGQTTGAKSFPTTSGAYLEASSPSAPTSGIFITKFNQTGSALVYSTLFSSGSPGEIAVNAAGEAYVTSMTSTFNVTRFNATGSALVYSSGFAPGTSDLAHLSIALDSGGDAYVAGMTRSSTFPVTSGAYQTTLQGLSNAFITKLGALGEIVYSTYF